MTDLHEKDSRRKFPSVASSGVILVVILGLFISGCNFAPKYAKPSVQTPAAFKEIEGWKNAEPRADAPRGKWWEMYGDTNLNSFEEQVNVSNQTVASAVATFLAARALVKETHSQLFPTVAVDPGVTRSRQIFTTSVTGVAPRRTTVTLYTLPLDASWEPDLWGSIRDTVQANAREAEATLADLENIRLSVHAEIAADYFQLRALDAQRQLLDSTVVAYQESLRLAQARYQAGIASDQDVAQAETQLNTTKAQATDIGIQRAQMEHALALLVGRPASTVTIQPQALKSNPAMIPLGVPSDLLERRPDIAAAERRVAEGNAQIGVARAAYFPALTLSGRAGFQNSSLANLVGWPSFAWSVGASLAETVFDAGRRSAVTERAWANYQKTVADYRQAVLAAFRDVEDNLSTLRIIAQELDDQDAAVKSSQRYLALANDRYKLGIDSYLNIILAQATLLGNQRTAVNLRLQQMLASVQLIKALGGGWDASQLQPQKQAMGAHPTARMEAVRSR